MVQVIARGILAHSAVRSARGRGCPERTHSATCSRDAGPPLPALHPHPWKTLTSSALGIPRMKDPRSCFWPPAQPPKCWSDLSASGRMRLQSRAPAKRQNRTPPEGDRSTAASRTHRGEERDLRCRHNLLSHSNPQARPGAPSHLASSSGANPELERQREWTGAPATSAAPAGTVIGAGVG